MDYGDLPEDPDERVHYVREINVIDSAEDVKEVQFIGDSTTVSVGITDDVMVEFLETAEQVFQWIHADMAEMKAIFDEAENEDTDEEDA